MTIPVFTPVKPGDDSMTVTSKPTMMSVQFGDGYSQDAGVGINPIMKEYAPKWTNAAKAEADYIINFLTAQQSAQAIGAKKFYWTPNGESTQLCFICDSFTFAWKSGRYCDITASFKQRAAV